MTITIDTPKNNRPAILSIGNKSVFSKKMYFWWVIAKVAGTKTDDFMGLKVYRII